MEKIQRRTIILDGQVITYTLTRKRVKNVNLRVKSDGVYVSANQRVSVTFVEEFIIANKAFILKHLMRLQQIQQSTQLGYNTGEKVNFLGEKFILQVIKSSKEEVCIGEKNLYLYTKYVDDTDKKRKLLYQFYEKQCQEIFGEIIEEIYPIFEGMQVKYPVIKLRRMKSKWGSCMPGKNQITLNIRLIELPRKCIEYVILHEFCHFIQPNHSKEFYKLVESFMPDYKSRRNLMKE